jgi:Mg2+ and Co2+ transporter CorA
MERLIADLKSMEGRLTHDVSTSTEVGLAIEEGRDFSNRLDDASATVEDMLKRGAEQRAAEEKEDEALEARLLAAEKEAEQLLARAAEETVTAKMIRKQQAARSLCRDLRRQNIDMQETRLRQLKECHQKLELQLKNIEQVGDPLSRSIANILAYKFA